MSSIGPSWEQPDRLTYYSERNFSPNTISMKQQRDFEALYFLRNEKKLPAFRAAPGHVLFYRLLSRTLDTTNRLFKIYLRSHKLDKLKLDKLQEVPSIEMSLPPNQVLKIDGNIVIEYPCDGGGVGLMEAWTLRRIISTNHSA